MKLKSCLNTCTGAQRWHDIFWKKKKFPRGQTNKGDQNTTGEGSSTTSSSSFGLFSILRCLTLFFLSCVLCVSALRGKLRRGGRRMQHEDGSVCPAAWHLGGSFKPLQVQTHRQTTVPPPRVARTNTKTKAYLYRLLARSFSLWWSFKARGVSVVRPLLFSLRCMSSSVNLSSFSVSVFSLTSLPVCPCFPFSFCVNIFYGNFLLFYNFHFLWSVNSPQILTLKNKIHLNFIDFYLRKN